MECPRCEHTRFAFTEAVIRYREVDTPEGMSIESSNEEVLQEDTISIKCLMCGYTSYGQHAEVVFDCQWINEQVYEGKVTQEEFMEVVKREAEADVRVDQALAKGWVPILEKLWQQRVADVASTGQSDEDTIFSLMISICPTDVQKLTELVDTDSIIYQACIFLGVDY